MTDKCCAGSYFASIAHPVLARTALPTLHPHHIRSQLQKQHRSSMQPLAAPLNLTAAFVRILGSVGQEMATA